MTKAKVMLVEPTNFPETEPIDLAESEREELEFELNEEPDRSRSPPSPGDLGVFETYEGFNYTPFDEDGEFVSPDAELNDLDCDILYDELLLDRDDEQRYEFMKWVEPQPEDFKCYSDYKNARWGYDSNTFMSGTEQAFRIWGQISPIEYHNGRWSVRSTAGIKSSHYDLRWAYACKQSFSNLPDVLVYTANLLSDYAGISTKSLKKAMKYKLPFVQLSARHFMLIDDYTLLTEHHPEVFMMIKDHPRKGPEYISSLITFFHKGNYPNKLEITKWVGQNGFETLVKYKVLKSMRTLGHRFSYYYYRTPDKSMLRIE